MTIWIALGIVVGLFYLALVLYYLVYEVITAPTLDEDCRVINDAYHRMRRGTGEDSPT
jgi:hypothetical protein